MMRVLLVTLSVITYAVLLLGTAYDAPIAGPVLLTFVGLLCVYAIVSSIDAEHRRRTQCPMCGRRLDQLSPPPFAVCTLCIAREKTRGTRP